MPKKETHQLVPVIGSFTSLELTGTPTGGGDAAIGQKLTELYNDAQAAELAILRFGAAFWAVEQGIKSTRGFNSPKAGAGAYGFNNWLADHAPEVAITTARRYRDIAEATARKFQIADPVRVFSLPASELDQADQDKRAAVVDFIANKSMRGLQLELGIITPKLGGARTPGEKIALPVLTAEQLANQTSDEVGQAIERIESLLIQQNVLQHMILRPEFIRGVVEALNSIATRVEKAAKPLLQAA
ncbi:MAG: hypothetical protein H2171_01095 [Opitutus sp.]|nr:hypothetical protein [Opitutus sp.]